MERNYKGKTQITKSIFDCVKFLTKGGATIDECSNYLKIGKSTVSRIRQADTYEEYKSAAKAAFYGYAKGAINKEAEKKLEEEQKKQEELKRQEEEEAKKQIAAQKPQPVIQTVQVQATHYMMEELREMNKILSLISSKLAFIVEQLQ